MVSKLILSTIGTSLLTNQIDRKAASESTWLQQLRDTANLTAGQLPGEIQDIIETLRERACEKLRQSDVVTIRRASAELNGICGFYEGQLPSSSQDMHWLIATDTAQGKATAAIVEDFLRAKGLVAQVYAPAGLSTADTTAFASGVDDLLTWLEDVTTGYGHICFNLVGGFKSLQAYLNTIGMFYANEIIYIFEGANSELIRIPRLPIQIDLAVLKPHVRSLALMAAGADFPAEQLGDLPETMVFVLDGVATLSSWGKLIWNKSKAELLAKELVDFSPYLVYAPSFSKDFQNIRMSGERVKLQETLARAAGLLWESGGNIAPLKADGGLLYEVYVNQGGIGHFRVNEGLRVSCVGTTQGLELRHYGAHDYVNDNP
jgi:putative CRISPR-associated protein (TIGR02619 family)